MSTIITRNSANSGSIPSSLIQGELAINVKDGRLFYGSGSGNFVKEFGVSSSYALTASYVENVVSASYALTASYAVSASYEINYETSSSYADYAVSASHANYATTASYAENVISASYSTTASYAENGGVTQIVAGTNITISPTDGKGVVTINAASSGSSTGGLPPRFILSGSEYIIPEGLQAEVYDLYNYGTLTLQAGTVSLPLGTEFITNNPLLNIENVFYNSGVINNGGIINNNYTPPN